MKSNFPKFRMGFGLQVAALGAMFPLLSATSASAAGPIIQGLEKFFENDKFGVEDMSARGTVVYQEISGKPGSPGATTTISG